MIIHTHRIPYKYGDTIRIKPLADIHLGNAHCDERAAKSWIDEDHACYFLGNGDLLDCVIASDAKRYRKTADASEGDDIIDQQINKMHTWLKPHQSRIIGLGTGNHEDVITKRCSTNPTKRLCQMLDVPFLGYSSLVRLVFRESDGRGRTVIIRQHHGWGGGSRTQGADLTKYSKDVTHWQADVYLYSHVHRLQSDRIPRLGLVGNKLVAKSKLIGLTGTFLKTYSDTSDPTYSEIKGYPPVEVGGLVLNIKPTSSWVKLWIDT